ncbi:MAG: tetratricopeptide repeat protein [Alphaproteobacteria bacterium]|nr:tetratricopeptide repeat protein [Alphaproteobacteria bacterium]
MTGSSPGSSPDDLFAAAIGHRNAGRTQDAVAALGMLLARVPGHADAMHMLGLMRHIEGDLDTAQRLVLRSIEMCETPPPRFLSNYAEVCRRMGRHREGIEACRKAIALEPGECGYHLNLGLLLRETGDLENAAASLAEAVRLSGDNWSARNALAGTLAALGRFDEAVAHLTHSTRLAASDPARLHELGGVWLEANRPVDAIESYQASLRLRPGHFDVLNSLAIVLDRTGRKLEAAEVYRAAIAASPATAYLHNNLGNVLRDLGDWPEALSHYRRALELDGSLFVAHSNVMFTRLFDPGATGAELAGEGRGWEARRGCLSPSLPPPVARDPEKRLRIGYVSPDFKEHAVAFFTEPLLRAHDRSVVEVVCYSGTPRPDRTTERLRSLADGWVETLKMGDGVLAERIRSDGIDILVDLAGHTHGNRLLALAARPAPVQVTAVLGYGGTTGLSWIGHVLTDGVLTPEGAEGQFTERVVRIPGAFAAFQPREEWAEAAPVPPGPPVFGCLSDPSRIDGEQLLWWRRLLEEVPGSRLLFKHGAYDSPRLESYWRSLFAAVSERSSFEGLAGGWGAHMGVYGRVSVVLDTWPVSGATSALIPLWMGVPVVAVAGGHAGQRFGAAVLTAAGLPELVAADGPGSVAIAAGLVRDGDRLRELRETLRGRLRASPLLDAGGHARAMEAAFRGLWREACAREGN